MNTLLKCDESQETYPVLLYKCGYKNENAWFMAKEYVLLKKFHYQIFCSSYFFYSVGYSDFQQLRQYSRYDANGSPFERIALYSYAFSDTHYFSIIRDMLFGRCLL